MLNRGRNDHWRSAFILVKRLVTTRSAVHLGSEMKMLNDKKQFREALRLFDICREQDSQRMLNSMTITQALKACTNTRDLEHGTSIHRIVEARSKEDTYILASLIHLYSKAQSVEFLFIGHGLQCNAVRSHAPSLCSLTPRTKCRLCMGQ